MRACDNHGCVTGLRPFFDDVTQTQDLLTAYVRPDCTHAMPVLLWLLVLVHLVLLVLLLAASSTIRPS
jgi:hypothetical protein